MNHLLRVVLLLVVLTRTSAFTVVLTTQRRRLTPASSPVLHMSSSEATETPQPVLKCPNCDLCDGSGRIAGGIGAILPWVPIKAYRPCPNFIERGGNYQRTGQGLDEIAFGRDSTFSKVE